MIFQGRNRRIALELIDTIIRLNYWLEKWKKSRQKAKERIFQEGKLYAYSYCLERLGFAHFWHPSCEKTETDYIAALFNPWQLSTGDYTQVFIRKDLFEEALAKNPLDLQKEILEQRKVFEETGSKRIREYEKGLTNGRTSKTVFK